MAASALLLVALAVFVAAVAAAALDTSPVPFDAGYAALFGGDNLVRSPDGRGVTLKLDRYTGSGFVSKAAYRHGFFSASIKLPGDYTAGVVVAFYLSNWDEHPKNHDELDFELLGNRRGHGWRVQTNMYGNGSTSRGREERYLLPVDATVADAHRYAIAWTPNNVVFYLDGVPIREVVRVPSMGGDFPSKPMSVYATIWDGSNWATDGGKYKVDYAYAPFAAEFSDLVLSGCHGAAEECQVDLLTHDVAVMAPAKRAAMRGFREQYLTYTACRDRVRYKTMVFPECDDLADGGSTFHEWGESKKTRRRSASPLLYSSRMQ
ncbi:probable xyloglucan endotransglucosylase/hydrolase protein 28 [Lolium perenne]|uniref:probable xyloglucan endotransglucosylase/hydrolase protein 28 n=1 Tax=Lolium perenne TaxID=4522 RepID=UPI0021EA4416|nr:probable xyloglucan endotransglucosylase/hydrolase protein 28 [Lolium perenne]